MNQLEIKDKCKCCFSGVPMADSQFLNMVHTDYVATWAHPTSGNVLCPREGMAIAVLHDRYVDKKAAIQYVLEFIYEDNSPHRLANPLEAVIKEVIYHPVVTLQKIEKKRR